jgi:hypothetical protein
MILSLLKYISVTKEVSSRYFLAGVCHSGLIRHLKETMHFKCIGLCILFAIITGNAFSQTCGMGSSQITSNGVVLSTSQSVCAGTSKTYGLSGQPMSMPSWSVSPSSAASFANGISTGSNVTLTWNGNGTLRVDYPDMSGDQCDEIFYSITSFNAGSISQPNSICAGGDITLTVSGTQNATGLIWQQCTSGCATQSNWTQASGTVSGLSLDVDNLLATTHYRTKLSYSSCGGGTDYSNEVVVQVNSVTSINVEINDPGPICGNTAAGLVFSLQESSSEVGSNPSYDWIVDGVSYGENGPGDSNISTQKYTTLMMQHTVWKSVKPSG